MARKKSKGEIVGVQELPAQFSKKKSVRDLKQANAKISEHQKFDKFKKQKSEGK